jgi:HEXXH motif-containing protein
VAELPNRALTGNGPGFHRLTRAHLFALASGAFTDGLIHSLRSAELSKNVLLLEAIRRAAVPRRVSAEIIAIIDSACEVLRRAQANEPAVVDRLLALPGFGLWAAEALMRLRTRAKEPDAIDIGHLAAFAAVAALRTRESCDLKVPVRDGVIHLPTLGCATLPPGTESWAGLTSDGHGVTLSAGSWELRLPTGAAEGPGWAPAFTLSAQSHGLEIRLSLEDRDPFLTQLAPAPSLLSPGLAQQWQQRLNEAWELLTRHHRDVAVGLAGSLTAIIPSAELELGQPVTATSGWAWGAMVLSLPSDALSFAEALTHEFHHLVLAAAEDVAPLTDAAQDDLCYAPWRDDPRPRSAMLQGCYAFFGVAGFWLRQSRSGSPAGRLPAQREFARRSENVADALSELRDWPGLTVTGRLLVARLGDELARLRAEPVDSSALALARQLNAEHREQWLRANGRRVQGG